MKRRRENNGKLFFHLSIFIKLFLILTVMKPASGTSLLQDKVNQEKFKVENGKGNVTDQPECSPNSFANLLSMLNSYQSEMKEVTGRLKKLENTVVVLNDRVVDQEAEIVSLKSKNKRKKRQTNSLPQCTKLPCAFDFPRNASKIPSQIMSTSSETSSLLPKSCSDPSKFGHTFNGIYPVQGSDLNHNKIALVFCQFSSSAADGKAIPDKQLGFVDIKSMPSRVAFFAHRDYAIFPGSRSIDFYKSKLNQGGALNLSTGVFTPPVNGTYAFHFRALANKGEVGVKLYHNDYMVTSAWFDGGSEHGHLGLSAALKLTTGDIVKLHKDGSGYIQDNDNYFTTFTGWLLEEDLSF